MHRGFRRRRRSTSVPHLELRSTAAAHEINVLAFSPFGNDKLWAGDGGYIATSDDGGEHWTTITPANVIGDDGVERVSGFGSYRQNLWFAMSEVDGARSDGLRGFAIDYSPDAGRSWITSSLSGCGTCSMTFSFIGPRNGWTLSTSGQLYRTTDGIHWALLTTLPTLLSAEPYVAGEASGVVFTSATNGWLTAGVTLFHSLNGGVSWRPVRLPQSRLLRDVVGETGSPDFFSPTNGVVAVGLANGQMFVDETTDGGARWTANPLPLRFTLSPIEAPPPTASPYFASQLVWSMYSQSELFVTDDGGTAWHRVAVPDVRLGDETQRSVSGFAMANRDDGWISLNLAVPYARYGACSITNQRACGTAILFMSTSDGGRNWHLVPAHGIKY
jgi:photosystem II stability/assembly factor-like uncharacterized protein